MRTQTNAVFHFFSTKGSKLHAVPPAGRTAPFPGGVGDLGFVAAAGRRRHGVAHAHRVIFLLDGRHRQQADAAAVVPDLEAGEEAVIVELRDGDRADARQATATASAVDIDTNFFVLIVDDLAFAGDCPSPDVLRQLAPRLRNRIGRRLFLSNRKAGT